MTYLTHNSLDKHQYNALFNRPIPQPVYDKDGKQIGTGSFMKYRINNSLKTDLKVASEDSGAKIFMDLYKKDRDFYNFVTDKDRIPTSGRSATAPLRSLRALLPVSRTVRSLA